MPGTKVDSFQEVGIFTKAIDIKTPPGSETEHIGFYNGVKTIQTKLGPNVVYEFVNEETGEMFGIFGFTNLNSKMANIPHGALVKIKYSGTIKLDTRFKKQQDVHQVFVAVNKNRSINDVPSGS